MTQAKATNDFFSNWLFILYTVSLPLCD